MLAHNLRSSLAAQSLPQPTEPKQRSIATKNATFESAYFGDGSQN